ncbi:MAG: hypothetical protein RML72_08075, partial [Bacteroidia bacterium]|nr:hypothetical protein [Bacteroidia bacterium]MDW8158816.1 hypothetical protein [Bacteroidia bacterium]
MVLYYVVLISPLHGQDVRDLPIIKGPRTILTPSLHYYTIVPAANFQIQWFVRGKQIEIKSSSNTGAFIQFYGRGIDTLIIRYRNLNTSITGFDTFLVHKNTCSAVAGKISSNQEICYGTQAIISLDTLIGSNIYWEYAVFPFTEWKNFAFPQRTILTPSLSVTTRFRAIVFTRGCGSDTSAETTVFVKPLPLGIFTADLPAICSGDTSSIFEGTVIEGRGIWETDGKGKILNLGANKARYASAPEDSGQVKIIWKVISANCVPQLYTQTIDIRPGPQAVLRNVESEICPHNLSLPIVAIDRKGKGRWESSPWGGILSINDTTFRFRPSFEARGRQIAITYRVQLAGCQPRRYQQLFRVKNAGVATIENSRPEIVCYGGALKLKATRRREYPGNYFWATRQMISEPSSDTPTLFPQASDTVTLTFYDIFTGCVSSDTLLIQVVENQLISYQERVSVCGGLRLKLNSYLSDTSGNIEWFMPVYSRERQTIEFLSLPAPTFLPDTSITLVFRRERNGCRQEGKISIQVKDTRARIKPPFPNFRGFCR